MKVLLSILFFNFLCLTTRAQEINWISFSQLSDSLTTNPKPVFLYFYTDWCVYCRKMDKEVFTNPKVVQLINSSYYAVKFDAESKEEFTFESQTFRNSNPQKQKAPHQIVLLLSPRNKTISYPYFLTFDQEFKLLNKKSTYLPSQKLIQFLETK